MIYSDTKGIQMLCDISKISKMVQSNLDHVTGHRQVSWLSQVKPTAGKGWIPVKVRFPHLAIPGGLKIILTFSPIRSNSGGEIPIQTVAPSHQSGSSGVLPIVVPFLRWLVSPTIVVTE